MAKSAFSTRLLRAAFLLGALGLLASGCQSVISYVDPLSYRRDFKETQKHFTQYIRWGRIEEASLLLEPELREEFLDLAPALTDLRITDYEIIDVDLDEQTLANATVDVRYQGYSLTYPVERTVTLRQTWTKDEIEGWQVSLDLAKLRTTLTGAQRP